MVGTLSSVAGLIGLLDEDNAELQSFALEHLDGQVDQFWTELAGSVAKLETLYEDEKFPKRQLASLVASKVYYHLGELDESMTFALGAGDLFDIGGKSEYIDTIISKCIDKYIILASPPTPSPDDEEPPAEPEKADPRLQEVVERMFSQCFASGDYKPAIGIAIDSHRLDVVEEGIRLASERQTSGKGKDAATGGEVDQAAGLMEYVLDLAMNLVQEINLREKLLRLILDMSLRQPTPDYFAISTCVVHLSDHATAAKLLRDLIGKGDSKSILTAYQIAFDLDSSATQEFLQSVQADLPGGKNAETETTESKTEEQEDDIVEETAKLLPGTASELVTKAASAMNEKSSKHYTNIQGILKGTKTIELNLEFLFRNNHTDSTILNKVKESLEARNSIFHTAVTFSNAFMNAGTLADGFLRANLDWLGKAVNWSKFSATAALGVIHRGNLSQGMKLLNPYLPQPNVSSGSPYSQGGSLYALGLIYANHGEDVLPFLRTQLKDTQDEIVQHGAALGLGVAGMATGNNDIYDELKERLWSDSAISGEAVGLSMGLIMLGTGNVKALDDMLSYAHDTEHEKIIRGLAIGMALIMYGRQEAADELIDGLLTDADPILRYGGIMSIALAYCGTGSNKAIKRVLHVAVSDVNDDVRRVAVFSLGFLLFRKPEAVPRMVELLSESYNPHVRYGAALALGISCAGTGLDEALDLLQPMMKDPTDFVRQGALISSAMILVQQNETMNPKVADVRKMYEKVVGEKHEDAMAKLGAALSLGIIDAGGRNCTIGLQTPSGSTDMLAVVGMAVFTQYWYWFPLTHFLSLGFRPTGVIGLNENLEVPDFQFWSNTKPSLFDYPPKVEESKEKEVEKIATAVLSTTVKARQRAKKTEKEKVLREAKEGSSRPGDGMDIDEPTTPGPTSAIEKGDAMDIETEDAKLETSEEANKKKTGKKVKREEVGYKIGNMSRVLPGQLVHISFLPELRYVPVKKPTGGVLLLTDNSPSSPPELLEIKSRKPGTAANNTTALNAPAAGPSVAQDVAVTGGGAAAAAAVLTAPDEDDDEEEAPVPEPFTHESDAEDED